MNLCKRIKYEQQLFQIRCFIIIRTMQSVSVNSTKNDNISFCNAIPFKSNRSNNNACAVDKFIKEFDDGKGKETDGNFFSKYMWSPTAAYTALLPFIGYEVFTFIREHKLRKAGKTDEAKQLIKKFLKNLAWLTPACIGIYAGIQYLLLKNSDKHFEKAKQKFNEINTNTYATLDEETFSSGYVGGIYSVGPDKIKLNKTYVNDPIARSNLKNIIKHELVHAKQSELVARSENGIKKLNYAVMQNFVRVIKQDKEALAEIEQVYNELEKDTEGKYDNTTLYIYSSEFNLKDFVKTLHVLINNDNATYNDIPMCIDEEHYSKIVKEKGGLTPDEEKQADEYYHAFMNYNAPKNFINAYNPFGTYRKNRLEKEAYK